MPTWQVVETKKETEEERERPKKKSKEEKEPEGKATIEDSRRAESDECYPVLCHPSGRECKTVPEGHDWIPENLQTVTVLPLGARPP